MGCFYRVDLGIYLYLWSYSRYRFSRKYTRRKWTNSKHQKDLEKNGFWSTGINYYFNVIFKKYFEPSFDILLPPPSQTGPESKPYTIVLDLDKFLVNHTWDPVLGKWRISKRPGVDLFLFYLAHMYEVVVYSSMSQMEAEPLMEKLDPYQMISYRLYRFATKYEDGVYKKDLSRLNRDMSKVIVLGHDPSFSAYPDNLIKTQPWNNDSNDTFLEDALPFLESKRFVGLFYFILALAFSNVPDVRTIIKPYEGNPIIETFQEKQRNSYESLRQQRLAANTSTVHRLLTKIFMPDLAREIDSGEGLMSYEERKKFISKQRKEEYNKEMSRIKIEYEKHLEASKSYLASQKMPLFDLVTKGPQPPPPPISTQQVSE